MDLPVGCKWCHQLSTWYKVNHAHTFKWTHTDFPQAGGLSARTKSSQTELMRRNGSVNWGILLSVRRRQGDKNCITPAHFNQAGLDSFPCVFLSFKLRVTLLSYFIPQLVAMEVFAEKMSMIRLLLLLCLMLADILQLQTTSADSLIKMIQGGKHSSFCKVNKKSQKEA